MIIGNFYRHPSFSFALFQENFFCVLDSLNSRNKCFSIAVDINISFLKCDQCIVEYLDCITCAGARQVVNTCTRYFSYFSVSSLIDHMYTSFRCKSCCIMYVKFHGEIIKMEFLIRSQSRISVSLILRPFE